MFGHPYNPYDVQEQFMTALYGALKSRQAGIFESPTGTGKTLSLLCPSVAWLRDAPKRALDDELAKIDASGGPAWARKAAREMKLAEYSAVHKPKRVKLDPSAAELTTNDDPAPFADSHGKVFFVSRTHSQLSQVAGALRDINIDPPPKFITLGSRKQLCVHPKISKLSSVEQINDKCAELQKSAKGCEYKHRSSQLVKETQNEIMDIEDLHKLGEQQQACPYYAAREAVDGAEVVAVPYALLLVASNREALDLDLQGSAVIIDEAHNLIEAVTSLHSVTLGLGPVQRSSLGLKLYLEAVGAKLGPTNQRKVRQLAKLVESLEHYFEKAKNAKPGTPINRRELLEFGNADTLDLVELGAFVDETKLVFKLESYLKAAANQDKAGVAANRPKVVPAAEGLSLSQVMAFALIATNPLHQGRLFHDRNGAALCLRFLVLDPAPVFADVVADASSVVLAGGTMEPMSDFTEFLFPPNHPISQHSYGHIVPKSQLLVQPLSDLRFTFAQRSDPRIIAQLGETVLSIVETTPKGVVVFFPGYSYLAQVVASWKKQSVWRSIMSHKRVFMESNDANAAKTDVFGEYSRHVKSGAVLFAVVGGRLSEGINFSDDLARAVAIVGLPFPNAMSAEMVAKRQFIEQSAAERGCTPAEAKEQARQYYENLAMRAVNQSVGRAIRHIGDYAAIYLIDARYRLPGIQNKLSRWIRENIEDNGMVVDKVKTRAFWEQHREK